MSSPPTRQQAALLRWLLRPAQPPRRPRECTRYFPGNRNYDDLPHSEAAARSCLNRMAARGWVEKLFNGRQVTYRVTAEGSMALEARGY